MASRSLIGGRTPGDMPGLGIAEQQAWQNFLDCALRLYAALIRVSCRCWMCGRWTFSLPSR